MIERFLLGLGAALALATAPAGARAVFAGDDTSVTGGGSAELAPYLQCVPYARQVTGIPIYGDAHTWWGQAEGRFARGYKPRVGAVMAFRPHGNSRLGHVAAVSRIVDKRTILIRHANWSPINGRRGQIEDNVRVIDVSSDNDWSAVRVWYAPSQNLGVSQWPVEGFIYPVRPGKNDKLAERPAPVSTAASRQADDPIAELIKQRLGW
jgi:surface antigen